MAGNTKVQTDNINANTATEKKGLKPDISAKSYVNEQIQTIKINTGILLEIFSKTAAKEKMINPKS